ncbi:MAG: peroxidase family protein [Bacteroidota bacterium]
MHSQQNPTFITSEKDHFTRLFPELDPLDVKDNRLWLLSQKMMDRGDCLPDGDSTTISNGLAIFSQFLAHDITFDSTSQFSGIQFVDRFQNDRTINFDLDCLYGQKEQTFYYDAKDKDKLLLGKRFTAEGDEWYDLQRNAQCKAIIPDARNDENIIVSRMQVLFIRFHNRMVDWLRRNNCPANVFKEARKLVIWHYHWVIIYDYLKKMMDPAVFEDLMANGSRYYTSPSTMPLEFSGAVFRVGHSQTRSRNRINANLEKRLFELGFFSEMEQFVDWRYIFDFGDGRVQFARKIDTKLAREFHNIPFINTDNRKHKSLAFRNLMRGEVYGLPSGEDLARRLGVEPIAVEETRQFDFPGTPLWFYVLREAEVCNNGEFLGPVGSRILGECFMTIMQHDDWSYLKLHPRWTPTLGREAGKFDFVDLICFALED